MNKLPTPSSDEIFEFEERAAIKEFDGNMSREEAERQAREEQSEAKRSQHERSRE